MGVDDGGGGGGVDGLLVSSLVSIVGSGSCGCGCGK